MRYCASCGNVYPEDMFYTSTRRKDGLSYYCKNCDNNKSKNFRVNNPDYAKEYRLKHIDSARISGREKMMKRKYGINYETFTELVNKQNNRCAICGSVLDMSTNTHVDHDHLTGVVRGILCRSCNLGLGNFYDDTEILKKAIDYLSIGGI